MTNHYDKLVYVDNWGVTRVQSANWDQEISDEDIEEIGNSGIIETIIDPIVPTTVTINTNDWGSTDFLAQLMGSEADVDGVGGSYDPTATDRNDWIVNSTDTKVAEVDVLFRVRDNELNTIDRTVWIPNCALQSVNWSYSVDGNATENVTLRGTTDRHLFGQYRQSYVEIGTWASATTFNVTSTATNYTKLFVSVNGTIYGASAISTWVGTLVTVTGIPDLLDTDRIRFVFYLTTANDDFTELDTSEMGAVKAPYVLIGLGQEDEISGTSKTLRLQSVDINVNTTREDLKEIGTSDVIKTVMTKQDVTVDATVLEDDMENFAKMLGVTDGEWTNRNTAGIVSKIQDSIGVMQELYVRIYDDPTQTNLLKTLHIVDLRLTSAPFSHDVGGQGQYSLSLKADNWSWTGGGDVGRLASGTGAYPTGYPNTID